MENFTLAPYIGLLIIYESLLNFIIHKWSFFTFIDHNYTSLSAMDFTCGYLSATIPFSNS